MAKEDELKEGYLRAIELFNKLSEIKSNPGKLAVFRERRKAGTNKVNILLSKPGLTNIERHDILILHEPFVGTLADEVNRDIEAYKQAEKDAVTARRKRIYQRVNELRTQGVKNFLKQVADDEGVSVQRIKQLLDEHKKAVDS